ncbi:MAG: hypothetical protein ACPGGK_06490 [Pikeienuella sp.]
MLAYILIALPFAWLVAMTIAGFFGLRVWQKLVAAYDVIDTIDADIKRAVNWFDDGSPLVPAHWGFNLNYRRRRHLNRLALYGVPAPDLASPEVLEASKSLRRILLPMSAGTVIITICMIAVLVVSGSYAFAPFPLLLLIVYIPPTWPSTDEIKERIAQDDQSA